MTQNAERTDPPMTPERFVALWDMAGQLIAAEETIRLFARITAQRLAIREFTAGLC